MELTGKQSLTYGPDVADIYKALADGTRRALLDELLERDEQTLFELCSRLAMKHDLTPTRQAVSQHLDVLQIGPVRADLAGVELESIDSSERVVARRKFTRDVVVAGRRDPRT